LFAWLAHWYLNTSQGRICTVAVYSTEIVQELFGAAKELLGDDSDRWVD
jgi:hypothetical protein